MIFYLIPPSLKVELLIFNDACFSRLKFFFNTSSPKSFGENFPESLTPGTKQDSIGHFTLRCFCIYNPEAREFILNKEVELFINRLEKYAECEHLLKKACKILIKDLDQLIHYKQINLISKQESPSYSGNLLFNSLRKICELLRDVRISEHFRKECKTGCDVFEILIPFQVCSSLIRIRSIELFNGLGAVPCSLWKKMLQELFIYHYRFGLEMINNKLNFYYDLDERWFKAFQTLNALFKSHLENTARKIAPVEYKAKLTADMIDFEKIYFPPCMSHLLSVLRSNHRLSYNWRYRFSLFLRDIGLNLNESIAFWKTEYSKSCSHESSCKHSWKGNERKYVYSIRHIYGLEGRRQRANQKSCYSIQEMCLGARDEGGCPFLHFDEPNLLKTLDKAVTEYDQKTVDEILSLSRDKKASKACQLHMAAVMSSKKSSHKLAKVTIEYQTPLDYYVEMKSCIQGT